MRKMSLAVLAFFIVLGGTANAQLPGALKKGAEKFVKDKLGDKDKDKDAGGEAGARPPARTDTDRKYPPGLSYSTVLDGLQMLAKNGKFNLHHIQGTFLPDDCKECIAVLRSAEGKELFQFDLQIQRLKEPYSLLSSYKTTDLSTGENPPGSIEFGTPGDYVLDFYLPTEHFYTFPFSVVKISGDDPFGPGTCYSLDGDWRDWGYLYHRDAKPDQSLQWKIWLRCKECEGKSVKVRVEITRDADGELVCSSRENTTHGLKPKWTRIAFDMVFPKGKEVPHGTYFKAKDLLEKEGAYTLTMNIDDEPYGTWKFAIEGGKLQYAGRAVRGVAAPLTFVEGGRDAWWYKRNSE